MYERNKIVNTKNAFVQRNLLENSRLLVGSKSIVDKADSIKEGNRNKAKSPL